MGEPGQRPANITIIDRPELKSPLRNITEGSITLVLWGVWLYFLLPFLTFLLWILGFRIFFLSLFVELNFIEFMKIFTNGFLIVYTIFIIQVVWVYYNLFKFKKRGERRKKIFTCSDFEIANFFKLNTEIIKKIKESNCIEVVMDNQKIIVKNA